MDDNNNQDVIKEEDIIWVPQSPHDDITAAVNALQAIDSIDDAMLSKSGRTRVSQIKRWALRIIHHNLKEIYASTEFSAEGDNEED